jgi:hypothetical protein
MVDRYDPSQAPDPADWLALDEQDRSMLVERHHRRDGVELPNPALHAIVHVVVENQLAANDDPVVRALARLMKAGLPRHDAIHAVGSVVAQHLFELLKGNGKGVDTPEAAHARYYASIERLTAASWRKGHAR